MSIDDFLRETAARMPPGPGDEEQRVPPVFTDEQVRQLQRGYPDGVSAAEVVEILHKHGVDLAEATFRKYVQLGLLPRSRRVGRKGKHQGSHGLYPVECVTRVADIRSLMDSGLTLEDIQRSAVAYLFEVDTLRRTADDVLSRLSDELTARQTGKIAVVSKKLASLRVQADALADAIERVANEVCPVAPMPGTGATTISRSTRPAAAARVARKKSANRPGPKRAGAHR